uniref:F-box domain-containing protein n=1 Tax=Oryza glumipatula TaxID=40148 RepID=A0A0E0B840_9ORYZ
MPPLRRARARRDNTPYTGGWLSRRRCHQRGRNDGALLTTLPDDVLLDMLLRVFSDATDVARFASTCPRWGSFVATHAATISRALPQPARFLPSLALGCFQQENDVSRCAWGRKRLAASSSPQPRFFPAASASRTFFLGPFSLPDGDPMFDYAQPVASRNGRVVFELRRDARSEGLTLVVSNPMTGDTAVLPPLTGGDCPGSYACAILTGDDLDTPPSRSFFRLLIIYNRPGFTAMRCYSSDAGSWGPKQGGKILDHRLRRLGHAVVVGGVAYWPLHREAFGVRLSDSAMDVCSVPYIRGGYWPDFRLLGVSPDGKKLRYITVGFVGRVSLCVHLLTTQFEDVGDIHDLHVDVPGLRVTTVTPMKLRWFGEKSGTVIFTIGDADGGVFALNMVEGTVQKLADGGGYHACRNIYGYEMDRATLIASLAD